MVEDEDHIRENLKLNLELEDYEVVAVDNGSRAIKDFREQRFDLVILDVMMPEMDGFDVCEQIRLEDLNTPILFLTAKDTSQDKIQGLKTGADDYMTKPFNLEELLLRVRNRSGAAPRPLQPERICGVHFRGNTINFMTYEAQGVDGRQTDQQRTQTVEAADRQER